MLLNQILNRLKFFISLLLMIVAVPSCIGSYCSEYDGSCNPQAWLLHAPCQRNLQSGAMMGCALSLSGDVSTFAGSGVAAATDGIGTAAEFDYPNGSTCDGKFIYVSDFNNMLVRKIEIETAEVSTYNNSGSNSRDVAINSTHLYVANSNAEQINKIDLQTASSTVWAGSGANGNLDGIGTAAQFKFPQGITVDGDFVYVSSGPAVRRIDIATVNVETMATGLNQATGIVKVGDYVYVANYGNEEIVRIHTTSGDMITFAGTGGVPGSVDGFGTNASFDHPYAITSDGFNLYVTDSYNNTIRKIVIATAEVTTIAGLAGFPGSTDGTGANARFDDPAGITTDGFKLYISDHTNSIIRVLE